MRLTSLQKKLRLQILKKAYRTHSGHPHLGSCFSCIDILIATLIVEMKKKDTFILSKGHASLALYTVFHYQKKITNTQFNTYFSEATDFGIHPPATLKKHIPLATGSLGHGLSFAAGAALGYQFAKRKKKRRVFCLLSDGECNEGAVWEAALFASHHKLHNLIVLIDKNRLQAFGRIDEVLGDAATREKWQSFGFSVYECNGHNLEELKSVFAKINRKKNLKPHLIICNTKRAYGIESLADKLESNYMALDELTYKNAIKTIKKL